MTEGSGCALVQGSACTGSFWVKMAAKANHPQLTGDLSVDVAIIGGGIAGITAAALLKTEGLRVAVLEARSIGGQGTGRSTAKVTSQHGLIYAKLIQTIGRDGAQAYASANQAAVERVASFVSDFGLDCGFQRQNAYVFTRAGGRDPAELEREAEAARGLGLPADVIDGADNLSSGIAAALRFTDQVQLNPAKYLADLSQRIAGENCLVFENTRVKAVERGSPCRVITEGGTVTARKVIVATHLPIIAEGEFHSKVRLHALPILAAEVDPARVPEGMFIGSDAPHLSFVKAMEGGRTYVIAAGGDYKMGDPRAAQKRMAELEVNVRDQFGVGDFAYTWTNHDYMSMDSVPFVGRASPETEHLYVATGFGAWGLSNGTAAAMILADMLAERTNSWWAAFDARRNPQAAEAQSAGEGSGDAAASEQEEDSRPPSSAEELEPGAAAVFETDGECVACHRDLDGRLHEVSAVCTHLQCTVGWNPIDQTWDCPCHGSRFGPDGNVLRAPAIEPLKSYGNA